MFFCAGKGSVEFIYPKAVLRDVLSEARTYKKMNIVKALYQFCHTGNVRKIPLANFTGIQVYNPYSRSTCPHIGSGAFQMQIVLLIPSAKQYFRRSEADIFFNSFGWDSHSAVLLVNFCARAGKYLQCCRQLNLYANFVEYPQGVFMYPSDFIPAKRPVSSAL